MDRKISELERLARLRDSGALTPAEFEAEKRRLLDDDLAWFPLAPWFPRRYLRVALTAVAVCSVVGLAAGMIVYRSFGAAQTPRPLPSAPAPLPSASPAAGQPRQAVAEPFACDRTSARSYARKRDLPKGAVAALGVAMAEEGGAFRVTDAGPVSDLPDRRFVSARQAGCTISLRYEKGGVAHVFETVDLVHAQGRWSKAAD